MRRDEDKGCEAMLIRRQGDQTRLGKERPMNKRTAATAWTTLALALVALRFGPGVARAQEIGPGVAIAQEAGTVVIDGLNGPMGVLVTPDGSVWAVDTGVGGDVEMELPGWRRTDHRRMWPGCRRSHIPKTRRTTRAALALQ